jgi:TP901 family phage tail tape measure protein
MSDLSREFGLSATVIAKTSVILAQSGLTAKQTEQAMSTLAKTTLAATFDSIASSTEGAVAIMAQFGTEASKLESQLGAINAVSKRFAVESGDIIEAVRRSGGAFRAAGGTLNEFIALFTAVRSTTRESAETIATGFRTIFARLQRPKTIDFFRQLNIELTDGKGNFIGAFEAIKRLSTGLEQAGIKAGSLKFAAIVEQLGGIRQVSRVIPLLQQFTKAEEARQVAIAGGNSLDKDAAKAQETLAQSFARTTQNFSALIREISQTATFQAFVKIALDLANAFIEVARSLKPLIPLIATFAAFKLSNVLGVALKTGFSPKTVGTRRPVGLNRGGVVPGSGDSDTVPAMLTPGEFVIRKSAVQAFGAENLAGINKYSKGSKVQSLSTSQSRIKDYISPRGISHTKDGKSQLLKDKFNLTPNDKVVISNFPQKQLDPPATKAELLAIKKASATKKGIVWEALLRKKGFLKGGGERHSRNSPIDGKFGRTLADAFYGTKSRSHGEPALRGKSLADNLLYGNKLQTQKLTAGSDSITKLPRLIELIPSLAFRGRVNASDSDKKTTKANIPSIRKAGAAKRKAAGGSISGAGTDTVPALLTPGEFVINKESAKSFGYGNLRKINKYNKGGVVQKFQNGGTVAEGDGGFFQFPKVDDKPFKVVGKTMQQQNEELKKNIKIQKAQTQTIENNTKKQKQSSKEIGDSSGKLIALSLGIETLSTAFADQENATGRIISTLSTMVSTLIAVEAALGVFGLSLKTQAVSNFIGSIPGAGVFKSLGKNLKSFGRGLKGGAKLGFKGGGALRGATGIGGKGAKIGLRVGTIGKQLAPFAKGLAAATLVTTAFNKVVDAGRGIEQQKQNAIKSGNIEQAKAAAAVSETARGANSAAVTLATVGSLGGPVGVLIGGIAGLAVKTIEATGVLDSVFGSGTTEAVFTGFQNGLSTLTGGIIGSADEAIEQARVAAQSNKVLAGLAEVSSKTTNALKDYEAGLIGSDEILGQGQDQAFANAAKALEDASKELKPSKLRSFASGLGVPGVSASAGTVGSPEKIAEIRARLEEEMAALRPAFAILQEDVIKNGGTFEDFQEKLEKQNPGIFNEFMKNEVQESKALFKRGKHFY